MQSKKPSFQTGWSKTQCCCCAESSEPSSAMWRAARKKELWEDSPILPWLVEHAGSMLSRCQKGRDGRTPLERLHGKKPTQEFVPFGEKVLARQNSSKPLIRMNPRCKFGVWLGVRNNSAECFAATAEGVFRAREVSRIEHQDRWDKEAINNVIGVPWRIADGNWIVDRPATQIDPLPPPPVPFEGVRVQRREQTLRASVPLQDARLAMRSNLESNRKLTQTFAEPGLRNVSKQLQKEQNVQIEEARCSMRHSRRQLRETSGEEEKS